MAIQLPPKFKEDLNTRNTNLIPVVTIAQGSSIQDSFVETSLVISTNSLTAKAVGQASGTLIDVPVLPLLTNLPSLKESIDPIDRRYKISSLTLNVSNYKYHDGLKFVDRLDNFINESIRIYWFSPSAQLITFNDLHMNTQYQADTIDAYDDRALQIFFGKIKKYDYDDANVRLEIEDFTQSALHKSVPVNNVGDGDLVPNKYKNKPYPMVYGYVENAPTVKLKADGLSDAEGEGVGSIKVYADLNEASKVVNTDTAAKIYSGNNYITVAKNTPQAIELESSYGTDDVEIKSAFGYKADQEVYKNKNNMIHLLALNEESNPDAEYAEDLIDEAVGSQYGNPVKHNRIIVAHQASSLSDMDFESIASQSAYWSAWEGLGNAFYCSVSNSNINPNTVYGTFGRNATRMTDNSDPSWLMDTMLVGLDVNGNTQGDHGECDHVSVVVNNDNWAMVGCNITTNAPKLKDIVTDEDGVEQIYFSLQYSIATYYGNLQPLTGDPPDAIIRHKIRLGSAKSGDFYLTGTDHNYRDFDVDNQWYLKKEYTHSMLGMPNGLYLKQGDSLSIYMRPTSNNDYAGYWKTGLKMSFNTLKLFQYSLIENAINQDFYLRCKGRTGQYARVPDILNDILVNELDYQGSINLPTLTEQAEAGYGSWYYDFSVNESINSKSLMENISAVSPYMPRFNNLGEFQFTEIPKNGGSITTDDHIIDADDCLDFSFKRTNFDKIYTKVVMNYDYDYGSGDFKKKQEVSMGDLQGQSNLNVTNYIGSKYGIENYNANLELQEGYISNTTHEVDEKIAKYIKDSNTAKFYASWLLTWHCNPHLIIKVRLPIKWYFIEVGEICKFNKLLGGIKPYNIDYYNGDVLNANLAAFNTFLVINSNKTLDYVEFELIQLHQLYTLDPSTDQSTVIGCMDENACNYDETANLNSNCLYNDCCGNCGGNATVNACNECCNNGINCDGNPCDVCGEGCDNQGGVEDECNECNGQCFPTNGTCLIDGVQYCDCGITPATHCCDGSVTCGECEACGCMDDLAINYDPDAVIDDNSCEYAQALNFCANIDIPTTNPDDVHNICEVHPEFCEGGVLIHNENQIGMYSEDDIIEQQENKNLWVVNPIFKPKTHQVQAWTAQNKLLYENKLERMRELKEEGYNPYFIGYNNVCYKDAPTIDYISLNVNGTSIQVDPSAEGVVQGDMLNEFLAPQQEISINTMKNLGIWSSNDVFLDPYIIKGMILKLVHDPEATQIQNIKMGLTIENIDHELNFDDNEEVDYNLNQLNIGNDSSEIVRKISPNIIDFAALATDTCAWLTDASSCEWNLEFDENDIDTTLSNQGETLLSIPNNSYSIFMLKNGIFPFEENYDINFNVKLTITINDEYEYNIIIPYKIFGCVSLGDPNGDGIVDVLDIVTMANCVLNQNCSDLLNACAVDVNSDNYYNVLDIVGIANCILNQNCDTLGG